MQATNLHTILPSCLPRLWRFAIRLTRHKEDAEDLVQRTCVRALERCDQLAEGGSSLSWLFAILHTVWLNEIRARQVRREWQSEWEEDAVSLIAGDSSELPENQLLYQQVVALVDALPDAQRVIMLLVAVEGMSYREASAILDIPIGTVMSRLARARLAIGQAFDGTRTKGVGMEAYRERG